MRNRNRFRGRNPYILQPGRRRPNKRIRKKIEKRRKALRSFADIIGDAIRETMERESFASKLLVQLL